jgi:CRP-like cAMP-binding protein
MLAQSNRRPFVKNTILASLSLPDLASIGPFLEPIPLKERMSLQEPRKPVQHVYFVESGIISIRIVAAGSILETAVVGYRGAIGISFLLGGHIPTHQSVVLFPGSALRIRADDLRRVMDGRPKILDHLSQYVQALNMHCAHAGVCGVRHELEQRLACWLCLACDALDGHVLPVTHLYLSTVLGLRRSGITEALIQFEEQGLIRKMRGVLQVGDRKRLQQKACSCYGIIASAYASAEHLVCVEPQSDVSSLRSSRLLSQSPF